MSKFNHIHTWCTFSEAYFDRQIPYDQRVTDNREKTLQTFTDLISNKFELNDLVNKNAIFFFYFFFDT